MTDIFNVSAGHVINPSVVVSTPVSAWRDNPPGLVKSANLSLYTGIMSFQMTDQNDDAVYRAKVVGYVLDGPLLLRAYNDPSDLIKVNAIATISSFGDRPSVVAVDSVSAALETQLFKDATKRLVLVLRANVAVQGCSLHALTYQVNLTSTFPVDVLPSTVKKTDAPGLTV